MSNSVARQNGRGILFIMSAPSGTGKTTLVERLVQDVPRLHRSRSYTSRPQRAGERDGVDYNFISRERFETMIRDEVFLEWADVFGNCYGTSAADTEAVLVRGDDVVLVIDVQGARQIRSRGIDSVSIFILPSSALTLAQRLRSRGQDTEEVIDRRLGNACREVIEFAQYDYVVVNDELEAAVGRLRAIVTAAHARVRAMHATAEAIVKTFTGG